MLPELFPTGRYKTEYSIFDNNKKNVVVLSIIAITDVLNKPILFW